MAYELRFDLNTTGAESLSAVDSIVQKLSGSAAAASGQLKIFEAVLKADAAAGISLAESLKTIASSTDAGSAGIKALAQEAQRFIVVAVEARTATDNLTQSATRLGAAHTAMVPQVAAASAAIRVFEGAMPIRAVERFAVNILGLGPLLQAAFPVIGAIAFGEVILHTGEKILKMSGLWGGVTKAEHEATAEAKKLDDQIKQIGASIQAVNLQKLTLQIGATAAKAVTAAQGPRDELQAQNTVNATLQDLAPQLIRLTSPAIAESMTGNEAYTRFARLALTLNEQDPTSRSPSAIREALNAADAISGGSDKFRAAYQSLQTGEKDSSGIQHAGRLDVQAAEMEKERIHDQSGLEARQTMESSREETQAQYNTVTEQENAAAAERKRQAEAAKQEAARRKSEEHRLQTMQRAGITDPTARAFLKANDDVASFTDPDYKQAAQQAAIADISRTALGELAKVQKELQDGRIEQEKQRRETDKRGDESFNKSLRESNEKLNKDKEDANKQKTFNNSLTTESTSGAVRANASKGAFADKMIGLNPELSDAQKISALNQQDLATAAAKYQIERNGAAELLGDDERAKASHKADLDNQLELQKVKEDNLEKLAQLENKNIEEFRGLIGGLFDAVASRQPNAVQNFVKSQVLGQARTLTENAAQHYLMKPLAALIPSIASPLTKGTIFEAGAGGKDAPTVTAIGATTDMARQVRDEVAKVYAALTGKADPNVPGSSAGVGGVPGSLAGGVSGGGTPFGAGNDGLPLFSGSGNPSSALIRALSLSSSGGGGGLLSGIGATDAYGNPIGAGMGNDGLPISGGGLNAALARSAGLGGGGPMAGSVEGALFNPNASTSSQVMSGVATAGVIAGGAIAAYKGFSKGGVGGDLSGIGAIAGTAAALDPEPISKAVLAVAAIALPLIGGFFNNPQRRSNAINTELGLAQYNAPQALNATQSSSGDFTDFDARGNIRTSNFSAIPTVRQGSTWEQTHGLFGGPPTFYSVPGGETSQFGAANGGSTAPVINHNYGPGSIQTIDATSFQGLLTRNSRTVGDVTAKAMQDGHGSLTAEVQRAINP